MSRAGSPFTMRRVSRLTVLNDGANIAWDLSEGPVPDPTADAATVLEFVSDGTTMHGSKWNVAV